MRCLVTGGSGFIGSHLVDALLRQGKFVRVLDDLSTGLLENLPTDDNLEFVPGSILDPDALSKATQKIDLVYHLAALPSVERSLEDPFSSHEVCVTGTLQVLEAAKRVGVRRVLFASSSGVYGNALGRIRKETAICSPLSPYAAAKLAAEQYCICYAESKAVETVRLRLFNVFGPRQRSDSPYAAVIPAFLRAFLHNRPPTLHGDGRQSRDFTYVDNVVAAFLLAGEAQAASGRVYNIGQGHSTCLRILLRHLGRHLGPSVKPSVVAARAGDVRHSQADISKAKRELGFDPRVSFVEGLHRTVQAFPKETQRGGESNSA